MKPMHLVLFFLISSCGGSDDAKTSVNHNKDINKIISLLNYDDKTNVISFTL